MKTSFTYSDIKNLSEFPQIAGIYKIENLINHKVYIGKSTNIIKRFQRHASSTHNVLLKRAFKKYGFENFSFEILIETYDLDYWEIFLIQLFNAVDKEHGYNLAYGGEGGKLCEESIEKMSKKLKGRKAWNKGLHYHKRCSPSEETRKKMSESHKGFKHTEESKAKMSKSLKGKNLGHPVSEKTRMLISIKNKNKVLSEETKEKIRQFNLGKKHPESKEKQHQLKSKKSEEYKEYKLNNPNSKITWNEFQSKFK